MGIIDGIVLWSVFTYLFGTYNLYFILCQRSIFLMEISIKFRGSRPRVATFLPYEAEEIRNLGNHLFSSFVHLLSLLLILKLLLPGKYSLLLRREELGDWD